MKFYKGTILSVDPNDGEYRFLVEDDGVIVHICNEFPAKYQIVRPIDIGDICHMIAAWKVLEIFTR